ncbi:hypothetical protein HIM_00719 [Hirsutella minnesotensis 3608]|nr:hypothetical protein HIM_00719 [Hirsutella minnesotensis 3608]
MSAAGILDPDPEPPVAVAPSHAAALVSSFSSFLVVALHSLLFHRRLYPPETFLVARAYSLPAFPTDPRLATAVADAHDAAVNFNPLQQGLQQPIEGQDVENPSLQPVNWTDVHESLRAALRKLAYTADSLPPPPDESTFTLAVELRDQAPAPIQHPQLWVPSEPHLQPPSRQNPGRGSALGGVSTVPIRSVQAGPLFFECWLEQGRSTVRAPADEDAPVPSAVTTTDADSKAS